MHWGIAGEKIADYQSAIAYAAIDAGADIVVGHGPHTLQAVETYRGRPALYSLGNLVFDWPVMHHRHREGLLARITLDHDTTSSTGGAGTVTGVELLPVRRDDDNQARLLTGPDADHMLQHVVRLGVPLSGRDEA